MAITYTPRNDYVLLRVVQAGTLPRPDVSAQNLEFIVVATGPGVTGLNALDRVHVNMMQGIPFYHVNVNKDLILVQEKHIIAVLTGL